MLLEEYTKVIESNCDARTKCRKLFISFPNYILQEQEDIKYDINNAISEFFDIPLSSIKIVGSSQLGFSICKQKNFVKGESDLDISIISKDLFIEYLEEANVITKSFENLTSFKTNAPNAFYKYIAKGILRPDLMPNSKKKIEWFRFFNKLSGKYIDTFKKINAGIYLSEELFTLKQEKNIDNWRK